MPMNENLPKTIQEGLDYLLSGLSLNDEIQITIMKKEDLPNLHFSLGAYIRNELGLWSGNEALLESCRQYSGKSDLHEDNASSVIIQALWERLQDKDILDLRTGIEVKDDP